MTQTEQERRQQEEMAAREQWHSKLRDLFEPYAGDLSGLATLRPKKELVEAGWNKHHLFPVTAGEDVYVHPDQTGMEPGYVRVVYHERRFVAVLRRAHFEGGPI